jgi:Family of unknown function (DUF6062)
MPKLEISKVHDAYAAGGECPLCTLREGAEQTCLRSFQHSRVMEPSVRVKTNESGFCPDHYRKLYERENKLGLGLVVHTHLQKKLPELRAAFQAMRATGRRSRKSDEAAASLERLHDRCFICDMLREDLDRYAFTILYLWSKDADFMPKFRSSQGFCLVHFLSVLAKARTMLRADRLERWLDDAVTLMTDSLERLERELDAFTQLHHDANRSLGTDEERTALARTLQKLAGGRFRLE